MTMDKETFDRELLALAKKHQQHQRRSAEPLTEKHMARMRSNIYALRQKLAEMKILPDDNPRSMKARLAAAR